MRISAEQYEISFDPENPNDIQVFNTQTLSLLQLTMDEAFALLQVMLKNRNEISQ